MKQVEKCGKSAEICPLMKFSDLSALHCSPLILLPYRLIIVRDVQQNFSSREDKALTLTYKPIMSASYITVQLLDLLLMEELQPHVQR